MEVINKKFKVKKLVTVLAVFCQMFLSIWRQYQRIFYRFQCVAENPWWENMLQISQNILRSIQANIFLQYSTLYNFLHVLVKYMES